MKKFILGLSVALLLAACSPDTQSIDGSWILVSGNTGGQEVPVLDTHAITLDIDSNHISGTAACNDYGGEMTADGGSLEMSEVFQTEVACIPEEVMDAEQAYLSALLEVDSYTLDGDRLVLIGPDSELVFEPAGETSGQASGLWTEDMYGAWQLTSGIAGGEPVPLVDTHPITLTIDGDGVGGTAACNHYGFDVGGGISITEMACFPPEVMESEAAYLDALARVNRGVVEDGLLLVGNGDVGVELRFVALDPVPTADLLGTVWVLESLVQEEVVSSVAGERATLELFSDGSFIGSTGCRTLSGRYVITGAEIVFAEMSADGDCPSDLQTQDSLVISALEGPFRVDIDGDLLTTWTRGDEGLVYRADS